MVKSCYAARTPKNSWFFKKFKFLEFWENAGSDESWRWLGPLSGYCRTNYHCRYIQASESRFVQIKDYHSRATCKLPGTCMTSNSWLIIYLFVRQPLVSRMLHQFWLEVEQQLAQSDLRRWMLHFENILPMTGTDAIKVRLTVYNSIYTVYLFDIICIRGDVRLTTLF